ncbi:guanylate kinase [Agaricicola taiwanensis]|uniref:guanylate kinase n=1 Tax=Agaricicola taiwanensis TaxID=591372 RepID=UPI001E5192A5|nr:guanylate kinase [Agaricicola taiwanensis]
MGRRGLMLVVSSPSGAGKTTLTRSLLDDPEVEVDLSVSVTTRTRRPSEVDGVHYHFIPTRQFEAMRESGQLLESAEVHGNFYGTPREPVERALAEGRDVLFDIDWQGTMQLYESARADVVSVFVLPPAIAELKSRLERRAQDSSEVISRRLENARVEIPQWSKYDYILVNEDLDRSYTTLKAILFAERARRDRMAGLAVFVDGLMSDLEALK